MVEALKGLSDRAPRPLARDQILEAHARHESSQQRYTPAKGNRDLLPIVYKRLAEGVGRPRVPRGLRRIRSVGGKLAGVRRFCRCAAVPEEVLQTRHPFQHGQRDLPGEQLQAAGLEFDAIYTAEDIGSYKPSARNFEYMIEKLGEIGVQKEKILHTSESMFHNHKPANEHGLKSCWIYRRHA